MPHKFSPRRQRNKAKQSALRPPLLRILALPALVMLGTLPLSANAILLPGDSVVVDSSAGTDDRGGLFAIKNGTGKRSLLSDFGNSSQGPTGLTPAAAAFESFSSIVAVDLNGGTALHGAVYRVDTLTGTRTLLSDLGDIAFGPLGSNPSGIAVEPSGALLVVDPSAGNDHRGRLFRIDPITGMRVILSNFADVSQGPLGVTPSSVALDPDGQILVTDASVLPGVAGFVFKIDPITGVRTQLSNFGDPSQGPVGGDPAAIAVEPTGTLLVTDPGDRFSGAGGGLYRVDPTAGTRVRLTDFDNPVAGPIGATPLGVAIHQSGKILVADADADVGSDLEQRGALFAVDPVTGKRVAVNDFSNAKQGPLGNDPVAVVPAPGLRLKHFKFNVKFDLKQKLLWVNGGFEVNGAGANVNVLKELIRLQLGSVAQFIPTDSCSFLGPKALKCEGQLNGTSFALLLRPLGKQKFAFYMTVSGLDAKQLQQAVPFSISLGQRVGAGTIKVKLKKGLELLTNG